MKTGSLAYVLGHVRRLAGMRPAGDLSDRQLLERFLNEREEAAFGLLLQRHGPMVLGVIHRVLGDLHEAEDAFQATFLVLARKAQSIHKRESLASWLHGVARRIALKARGTARCRPILSNHDVAMIQANPLEQLSWQELRAVLDEELARLPDKYRAPVILCYLEGKTQETAAAELGCPKSSLGSRLVRARELLRESLGRRGVTLSAGMLAGFLAENTAPAAVPASLFLAAVRAVRLCVTGSVAAGGVSSQAVALADGVSNAMTAAKLNAAVLLFIATGLVAAAGVLTYGVPDEKPVLAKDPKNTALPQTNVDIPKQKARPTDRHGDPLPAGAVARLGTVRFRLGGLFYSCAFSPDGKTLAASSADGGVYLFDPDSGRPTQILRHHRDNVPWSYVGAVCFSPGGTLLASAGADGQIVLWNPAEKKVVKQLQATPEPVNAIAFSGNGKQLASGDNGGVVRLWDVAVGKELRSFRKHNNPVRSVALSADGGILASGSQSDGIVRLWETSSGRLLHEFKDAKPSFNGCALAFSHHGGWLACGLGDGTVQFRDAASGEVRQQIPRQTDRDAHSIWSLGLSDDGKYLATGHDNHSVRLWDLATGKKLRELSVKRGTTYTPFHHGGIPCLAFSPDGKRLVFGEDHRLRLWDVNSWRETGPFAENVTPIHKVLFASGGKTLITASSDLNENLREWGLASKNSWRPLHNGVPTVFDLSPDRKTLVTTDQDQLVVRDLATGKELGRSTIAAKDRSTYPLQRVTFAASGQLIAGAGTFDGLIYLWKAPSGKEIWRAKAHEPTAWYVAISPDGKRIASCGDGPAIKIYDAAGRLVKQIETPEQALRVVFSPNGKLLAAALRHRWEKWVTNKFTIDVWELASGKKVFRSATLGQDLNAVTFSPDGSILAGAGDDRLVHLWDMRTRQEIRSLQGHHGPTQTLAFSPDGRLLASGSADTTALLWDLSGSGSLPRVTDLSPEVLRSLWEDLAGLDAARAQTAIWRLSAGRQTIGWLRERLRPVLPTEPARLARLLADLDSTVFSRREKATSELEKLAELANPALRKALTGNPSLELRRRIESLLQKQESTPPAETLRALRAIDILERMDTPEARNLLQEIAGGAPEARVSQEAQEALARLRSKVVL